MLRSIGLEDLQEPEVVEEKDILNAPILTVDAIWTIQEGLNTAGYDPSWITTSSRNDTIDWIPYTGFGISGVFDMSFFGGIQIPDQRPNEPLITPEGYSILNMPEEAITRDHLSRSAHRLAGILELEALEDIKRDANYNITGVSIARETTRHVGISPVISMIEDINRSVDVTREKMEIDTKIK